MPVIDQRRLRDPARLTDGDPGKYLKRLVDSLYLLEKTMNIKNIIVATAILAAAGSSFAQQTEFVAPDAGFKSTLTRAQVRQELAQAYAQGDVVQRQHDGQDTQFAGSTQTREQVRKEAARAAQTRHAGDVNDLYFGA